MTLKRIVLSVVMLLAAASLWISPAGADPWPARPIRFVVPLPPGGAYDYIARLLADQLRGSLGVAFVVDNKPGASTQIGSDFVARSAADGYTILMVANTHVILPHLTSKLPYDAIKSFQPVSLVVELPFVLSVVPKVEARTASEFIQLARSKPGAVTYGSTGIGSPFHLHAELLKSATGIDIFHVPYKGTGPLIQALLSEEVSAAFVPVGPYLQYIRAGKLRPLALVGRSRTSLLPDVPTMAEAVRLNGYGLDSWLGVLAPAGTPRPIVDRLSAAISRAVNNPQFAAEKLRAQGYEPVGSTPEQFLEAMKNDFSKYAKIVKDANITPE